MFEYARTRRARRIATARLAPLAAASRIRLGGIPSSAWFEPVMLGFIMTLATRIVLACAGRLSDASLARAQAAIWADLSGEPAAGLGERVIQSSLGADPRFVEGCAAAEAFLDAIEAQPDLAADVSRAIAPAVSSDAPRAAAVSRLLAADADPAWRSSFDRLLGTLDRS